MEATGSREVMDGGISSDCEGVCNNQDQVCEVFMVGQNVISLSQVHHLWVWPPAPECLKILARRHHRRGSKSKNILIKMKIINHTEQKNKKPCQVQGRPCTGSLYGLF